VRPFGRLTAGFDNALLVRVTDPKGMPWSGPAAVRLLDGELGDHRGRRQDPPLVWEGRTNAAGLATLHGALSSDVLRLLVQLRAEGEPAGEAKVLHERRIQLTSFAGAVYVAAEPVVAAPGGTVDVLAAGLGAKRPVFVDVYGPDGAWIDTFDPPVLGREPERPWTLAAGIVGLVQLEGYHFTNAPGESTAVARVLAVDPSASAAGATAALRAGIERQRARLSVRRSDRTWDAARERGYLDALGRDPLPAAALPSAERWVIGTLPVEVHGPPTLLRTRERDEAALLDHKRAWIMGLRIFVFGGGALYLISMTVLMLRTQSRDAAATLAEMRSLAQGDERETLEQGVRQARRATMARGVLVLLVMAAGLVIAVLALEILVWEL
jgi:hypothetical protein